MFLLPIGILFAPVFFVVPAVAASSLLLAVPIASISAGGAVVRLLLVYQCTNPYYIAKVPALCYCHCCCRRPGAVACTTGVAFASAVEDTNGVSFVPALLCIPVAGGVNADDGVIACIFFEQLCFTVKNFLFLHHFLVDMQISMIFES
jgi:hypothetical protein